MTEGKAKLLVRELGYKDVMILFMPYCHAEDAGTYYPDHKLILVYTKDENGERLPDEELEDTVLHELAHHVQCCHTPNYKVSEWHDEKFYEILDGLKNKYYNREVPLMNESQGKRRRLKRVSKEKKSPRRRSS